MLDEPMESHRSRCGCRPGPYARKVKETAVVVVEDVVDQQVRAYNDRDLDRFVSCYAEAVVVEDSDGAVVMSGREEMRGRYAQLFASAPNLHGEILTRMRVGSFVVDEERITGRPDGEVHVIAIYRLDAEGLIDRVRILR